ncbi:uncharacterized protein L969DRAFT_49438 [Mixia osmundae IAM 14324]|uniref:Ribosomal RNA-processing protein 40 n=1 Tax=Mixia osmundae (strain CBS 9802 / IAM 14324 / JCM 22182 / KY 12970) TaxID=764103 RepID=G7DVQ3_MIXOS|nr:uncharacterized protein L969DRAFT_49438 [Mixia osmundae IAM 14324]KEI39655.1 hypothetical protein L969DRAFT_49438 [Mixia osmundae IAM 14324]GAA94663.1 hypothetical protein E5Q_01316 [Mixia osmundae IAM 14324]
MTRRKDSASPPHRRRLVDGSPELMTFVLPGETAPRPSDAISIVKLGPGLGHLGPLHGNKSNKDDNASTVTVIKSGLLGQETLSTNRQTESAELTQSLWIDSAGKRYNPSPSESVIGFVTYRGAEGYRVDIGASQPANLDALAFQGATKRSKPQLNLGAAVYARVSLAYAFVEPEIECYDPTTQKSAGFGELEGGMILRDVPLRKCRELLADKDAALSELGKKMPFELAIGVNGRIWLKGADTASTLELYQTLANMCSVQVAGNRPSAAMLAFERLYFAPIRGDIISRARGQTPNAASRTNG